MRWMCLGSRQARLNIRRFDLSSSTPVNLQPSGPGPQLQNHGRRHVATKDWPQTRSLRLGNISPRRRPYLPEDEAVVEHGKPPLSATDRDAFNSHAKLSASPEAIEQGDISDPTKTALRTTIAERGNTAKLTETVKPVQITEHQPFYFAAGACDQNVKEHPNVSHRTNKAGDRKPQPAGHAVAFGTKSPSREPLAISSADHTGFSIDAHGRLRVTSTEAALRKHPTALVVRSVSRNMVEADFTRLLAHTPDPESGQGGLLQAIPGRDVDCNRLSYWILLFDCPYNAASFQHRLRWYHANATLNLPIDPYKAATMKKRELAPPEGYVDPVSGENVWKRLHEFALLLPTQSFDVTAILAPFPDTVHIDLRNQHLWKFPKFSGETWPVMIWVDGHILGAALVERFLTEDGGERGFKWDLFIGVGRIEPVVYTRFSIQGDRIDRERKKLSNKDLALLRTSPPKSWIVRFRTEESALHFWRTWHRRPFPEPLSQSPGQECLLHVDRLW